MSTFIVRFLGRALDTFHGKVRHVTTGEESSFSNPTELVAFMEEVNGIAGLSAEVTGGADCPPTPVARHPARRARSGRRPGVDADAASQTRGGQDGKEK